MMKGSFDLASQVNLLPLTDARKLTSVVYCYSAAAISLSPGNLTQQIMRVKKVNQKIPIQASLERSEPQCGSEAVLQIDAIARR
jgi:hypothetical protein